MTDDGTGTTGGSGTVFRAWRHRETGDVYLVEVEATPPHELIRVSVDNPYATPELAKGARPLYSPEADDLEKIEALRDDCVEIDLGASVSQAADLTAADAREVQTLDLEQFAAGCQRINEQARIAEAAWKSAKEIATDAKKSLDAKREELSTYIARFTAPAPLPLFDGDDGATNTASGDAV